MTNKEKLQAKKTIQREMKEEFGYAPTIKEITLLESSSQRSKIVSSVWDFDYLLFRVGKYEYCYDEGRPVFKQAILETTYDNGQAIHLRTEL